MRAHLNCFLKAYQGQFGGRGFEGIAEEPLRTELILKEKKKPDIKPLSLKCGEGSKENRVS